MAKMVHIVVYTDNLGYKQLLNGRFSEEEAKKMKRSYEKRNRNVTPDNAFYTVESVWCK